MSSVYDIYAGAVGVVFPLTFEDQDGAAINLTSASAVEVRMRKPDGTVISYTKAGGTVVVSGASSNIGSITTTSGQLNLAGEYVIQGVATVSSGVGPYYSTKYIETVKKPI